MPPRFHKFSSTSGVGNEPLSTVFGDRRCSRPDGVEHSILQSDSLREPGSQSSYKKHPQHRWYLLPPYPEPGTCPV